MVDKRQKAAFANIDPTNAKYFQYGTTHKGFSHS